MDDLPREIQALDRAISVGECRPLSAVNLSRLATRRRKRRAISVTASIGLATCAIYGLVTFLALPHTPESDPAFEYNQQLIASIKATQQELKRSVTLRRETEQLLAELRNSSTNEATWSDPTEEASLATFSYARQMLSRGVDSGEVQDELKRLQQAFPGTVGAERAEKLAADLANPGQEPAMDTKSSSRTIHAPAWNQIAKES